MFTAAGQRYQDNRFRRCGESGLLLPDISLGLWHNFGTDDDYANAREMIFKSFDHGITHFDLANNYGPPYGAAEETFGKILKDGIGRYRDELIISTKAGWDMWSGPYGDFGSKKYLVASLDQSLSRMGLDYVDIYYHHRPDPETPLEETVGALLQIHRQGKALYLGISQYDDIRTRQVVELLSRENIKLLIHQPRYNLFDRWIETKLAAELQNSGVGCIAFSPLAQGLLTNKYFQGIPENSRVKRDGRFLNEKSISPNRLEQAVKLNELAKRRDQSLAQMAINWVLRDPVVTSALIGASRFSQVEELLQGRTSHNFTREELSEIDSILSKGQR